MFRPRIGALGLGWIGRQRLEAVAESGRAEIVAIADADPETLQAAASVAPRARRTTDVNELLDQPLDGLMIATPSAMHADHTRRALERGLAVFCQKPLARSAAETRDVVALAQRQNRLLHVDMSYRFVRAFDTVRRAVQEGVAGPLHAIDLTFHNAYGPDKAWYYTRALAGGGCVMDLGIHLVDLLVRLCGPVCPEILASQLFRDGQPWRPGDEGVEDLAFVQMAAPGGAAIRLTCSWRLPAGCDAVIEAAVFGPRAGLRVRNVKGSFYDFVAERLDHGGAQMLDAPPDAWGGRAAVAWVEALARDAAYDPSCEEYVTLARLLDEIYASALTAPLPRAASRAARPASPPRQAGAAAAGRHAG